MPKNGIIEWGWSEMEELLQCPVCLDIPVRGVVEQCRHGHHICANCKKQVETCPLCKCDFHGTRNFVVEELIRHFEILKNTMLLNNIVNEAKSKKKGKTKLNVGAPIFVPGPPVRKVNTPNSTKGVYPCRVTDCDVKFPAARLLNHVRTSHADVLTETIVDFTDSYNQTWEITYKNKKSVNTNSFVIFVRGIGLIFLNIEILRSGQLIVVVQMGMKFKHAQNFLACVEFFTDAVTHSYTTRLISVRDTIQAMMQKKLCFTLNKTQLKSVCVNKKFKCRMRLSRFNNLDSNVLTVPNVEQINMIAAMRASLIQEENDKKLLKELEVSASSSNASSVVCAMNVVGNKSGGPSRPTSAHQQARDFEKQIQKLENAWKILTDSIQKKEVAQNGSGSSTSREPENGTAPAPTASRSEPVAGRRRNNRNRRNKKGMTNGTAPEL